MGKSMPSPSIFQTSPNMKVGRHEADRIQRKLPVAFLPSSAMPAFHCCVNVAPVL